MAASLLALPVAAQAPNAYQSAFDNARAWLKQQHYADALNAARYAISNDSSQWGAHYVAGAALIGLNAPGDAMPEFQLAAARAPESARPTINDAIASCQRLLATSGPSSASVQLLEHQAAQASANSIEPWLIQVIVVDGAKAIPLPYGIINGPFTKPLVIFRNQALEINGKKALIYSGSGAAAAHFDVGDSGVGVSLVELAQFQGQNALSFQSQHASYGVPYGHIFVTANNFAFVTDKGKLEALCNRSGLQFQSGKTSTFRVICGGKVHDFWNPNSNWVETSSDSPFMTFLQQAITDFPRAYGQIQQALTLSGAIRPGGEDK